MENDSDEDRERFTLSNLRKFTFQLENRIKKNQQDRLTYPDDPEKWIKSEVDLDEQIRIFSDLSTLPELYNEFQKLNGFRTLSDVLTHPNIDIVISTINVLLELIDPEVICRLDHLDSLIKELESLNIHKLCVEGLYQINEGNSEVDYEGAKGIFELLENLLELSPLIVSELSEDDKFLLFY